MRAKDKKELCRYVRWIADELGLRDWTVELITSDDVETAPCVTDRDPTGEASWSAMANCVPGRKIVYVILPVGVRDKPLEQIRQTVCHELVHPHFFAAWDQTRRDLHGELAQQGYDLFIASFERNLEYGVDALADVLAKHMPLIEWPA